ncbi:hypothetical protein LSAT2_030159 [Lamellibrachia satsuma]|nr:hypothetical protein LSAT2_030159 [Lamellibrachia satsuma]
MVSSPRSEVICSPRSEVMFSPRNEVTWTLRSEVISSPRSDTTATIVCACRSYYRPYQPAMTFEQWDIDDGTRKRRFRLVGRNTAIYVGLITFALIVAVGLFVFFNYYMACKTTPDANHAAAGRENAFDFDDIFNSELIPKHFASRWLHGR